MSKWLDYILFASNGESGQYYRAEGMCCTDSLSCQANTSDCLRGTFEADEADTIIPTINRAGLL